MSNQKGVVQLLILIILLAGLGGGLYLVQTRTNLLPKAAEDSNVIQIVDKDGNLLEETVETEVYLRLKLPSDLVFAPEKGDSTEGSCSAEFPYIGRSCIKNPPESECPRNAQWCDGGCCRYNGSTANIVKSILIKNEPLSATPNSVGSEDLTITSDFQKYLGSPIPWKLHGKLDIESPISDVLRKVAVRFVTFDGRYRDYEVRITLTRPGKLKEPSPPDPTPIFTPPPNPTEYKVNIYIHESLRDYFNVSIDGWAKNTIENFINQELWRAGINKKLVVEQIFNKQKDAKCPLRAVEAERFGCPFNRYDPKIQIWMYKEGVQPPYYKLGGVAHADSAQIGLIFPYSGNIDGYKGLMAHEIGHIFGMPDYYLEKVEADNNKVVPLKVEPFVIDIMEYSLADTGPLYSELSKKFADRRIVIPFQTGLNEDKVAHSSMPGNVIFEITDDNQQPIKEVKIEIFRQSNGSRGQGASGGWIFQNIELSGNTNEQGRFVLGNPIKFLGNNPILGYTLLLRLTYNDQVKYLALTRSYLNYLYFNGQVLEATISTAFSTLEAYGAGTQVLSGGLLQTRRLLSLPEIPKIELTEEQKQILENHRQQHLEGVGE